MVTGTVDNLDKIVIPMEIGNRLGLLKNANIEFFITTNSIVMQHTNSESCHLCGDRDLLIPFKSSYLCRSCAKGIKCSSQSEIQEPSKLRKEVAVTEEDLKLKQLIDLMKLYPNQSLKTYAQMTNTTPGYVSRLNNKIT
ncbi:hypothetical protein ABE82_26195 (plasmid) [Paenibacillus peoriae]|nr:hypothetical protein ABE82_26195 [Paenibacillus peoriae]